MATKFDCVECSDVYNGICGGQSCQYYVWVREGGMVRALKEMKEEKEKDAKRIR